MDNELLVAEIRRLRELVVGAYPYVPEGPGTVALVRDMEAVLDALPRDRTRPGGRPGGGDRILLHAPDRRHVGTSG